MARLPLAASAVLLGVALAACSTPPPPPPPPVAVAPPSGPVSFDGAYNGTMELIRGSNMSCGSQDMMSVRVVNNAFRYTLNQPQVVWQKTRSFDVAIAPDGSFQSQSGPASIRGRTGGGHMQGEINGDSCGFRFEADSTGTW